MQSFEGKDNVEVWGERGKREKERERESFKNYECKNARGIFQKLYSQKLARNLSELCKHKCLKK